jgi:hypothetical protein
VTKNHAQQRFEHIAGSCPSNTVIKVLRANSTHLSLQDQNKLLGLLIEIEELFDGTLGDWNTKPVSFELKEGTKPYHGRPFPVPRVHKDTIVKELNRLCDSGVLVSANIRMGINLRLNF